MNVQAIETISDGLYSGTLYHDQDAADPRKDSDHLARLACSHNDYILGDEPIDDAQGWLIDLLLPFDARAHGVLTEAYDRDRNVRELVMSRLSEHYVIKPLFLYDHSGITMRTTPFSDPWDSGQVGFAYISVADVKREFPDLDTAEQLQAKGEEVINAEVATYDMYLRGDVYGYTVVSADGDELDSLWGLYGFEYAKSQLREALAAANAHANEVLDQLAKDEGIGEQPNATYRINDEIKALLVATVLIQRGHSFSIEPWPDGAWRVTVKDEHPLPVVMRNMGLARVA